MGGRTNFFLRLMAAIHESRRRQADLVLKRYAHMLTEAEAYQVDRPGDQPAEMELPQQFKRAS